jgi:hypothetical protein
MVIVLLSLILTVGVVFLLIESRPNLSVLQLIERVFGGKKIKGGDKPDNKK